MKTRDHIQMDPAVMLGKPTLRGTRVTVELVLRKISEGASEEDLIRAYPQASRAAIRAAVAYAAETIAHEEDIFAPA